MDANILTVAIDAIKGKVTGNYSATETSESLRKAFIELNGGSTKINPKTFRRGNELFDLIEEILPIIIDEGLTKDHKLLELVDYRNIKLGDENEFETEGEATFIVRDTAAGVQGVRRQRIGDGEKVSVKTTVKTVRVYEDLNKLLSGRIDFNRFIDGVTNSFIKQIALDAYTCLHNVTATSAGLNSTYVIGGSYKEEDLKKLIAHVEAANGKSAMILGTKLGLGKITTAEVSEAAKTDRYSLGYYGNFNGTPMISVPQVHKEDGITFALDDDKIYVIAADDKPVKMVNEGDGLLDEKSPTANADLTKEYVYMQAYGTAFIACAKMGVMNLA